MPTTKVKQSSGLGKFINNILLVAFFVLSFVVIAIHNTEMVDAYTGIAGFILTALGLHMGVMPVSSYLQGKNRPVETETIAGEYIPSTKERLADDTG